MDGTGQIIIRERRAAVWLMSWSPLPPHLPSGPPPMVAVFRQAGPRVSAFPGKSRRGPGVGNGKSFACWVCSQGRPGCAVWDVGNVMGRVSTATCAARDHGC